MSAWAKGALHTLAVWTIINWVEGTWESQGQTLLYQSGSERKSREFIVMQYNNPKADIQLRFIYGTALPRHDK